MHMSTLQKHVCVWGGANFGEQKDKPCYQTHTQSQSVRQADRHSICWPCHPMTMTECDVVVSLKPVSVGSRRGIRREKRIQARWPNTRPVGSVFW